MKKLIFSLSTPLTERDLRDKIKKKLGATGSPLLTLPVNIA